MNMQPCFLPYFCIPEPNDFGTYYLVDDSDLSSNLCSDDQPVLPSQSSFEEVSGKFLQYVSEADKIKGQLAHCRETGSMHFNIYSGKYPIHLQLTAQNAENIHDCVMNGPNKGDYGVTRNFVNENGVSFNKALANQMPSSPVPEVGLADRPFDLHPVFPTDKLIADIASRSTK
jgi:hypothetical protein